MCDIDVLKAQVVRRDASEPWGFRLQGGTDVGQPLTIVRLTPGSPAARIGLQPGDEVVEIDATSTSSLSYQQALDLISSHTDTLLLTVERAATGRAPVIPRGPSQTVAPTPKSYQTMDMTGHAVRRPVTTNRPVTTFETNYSPSPPVPQGDVGQHRSTASYELQQPAHNAGSSNNPQVIYYSGDASSPTRGSGYDNGAYSTPPRQVAAVTSNEDDDPWSTLPQSRTFKVLQSVMHNEEPAAGVAGLPPPRSAAMEQMRRQQQQQQQQAGGQRVKVFMPQQYNSPMGMYSAHNVLETFTAQAESMLDTLERRQPQSPSTEEQAPVHSSI